MNHLTPDQPFLRSVIDAIPSLVFVVDSDLHILDANQAARDMLGDNPPFVLQRLCGEVLHCLHEQESEEHCGKTEFCKDCALRKTVSTSHATESVVRDKYLFKMQFQDRVVERMFLIHAAPLAAKEHQLYVMILEDITELTALRRLTTICAYCSKIRNEEEKWERIDSYLARMDQVYFSHGICNDCFEIHCPKPAL
jgi:PAS domain-containing protein